MREGKSWSLSMYDLLSLISLKRACRDMWFRIGATTSKPSSGYYPSSAGSRPQAARSTQQAAGSRQQAAAASNVWFVMICMCGSHIYGERYAQGWGETGVFKTCPWCTSLFMWHGDKMSLRSYIDRLRCVIKTYDLLYLERQMTPITCM